MYIVSAQENVGLKADRLKKSLGLQNKGKLEIEQVKVKERLTRSDLDNMSLLCQVEAYQVRLKQCVIIMSRRGSSQVRLLLKCQNCVKEGFSGQAK